MISIRPMDKHHSNIDIGLSIWDLGTNGAPLSNKHESTQHPSMHAGHTVLRGQNRERDA